MDAINFTANHLRYVNIAKRSAEGYKPCRASLVEMKSSNPGDVNAIDSTAEQWEDSLTAFVSSDMKKAARKKPKDNFHVYAITTQKKDFDNINPEQILGVAHITENANGLGHKIEVLQTNPEYMFDRSTTAKREYKNVGKGLISFIKENFNDKPLYLYPTKDAVKFYEKQGFSSEKVLDSRYMFYV
ncbi:MAG: hypothetical protein K6E29_08365 [Cyanobacteria bacterium RUI128]|nr:hypothetical protein [Cyanobacteria bacterium RUI128]